MLPRRTVELHDKFVAAMRKRSLECHYGLRSGDEMHPVGVDE